MPIPIPRTPVRVRIAPSPTGDPHVGTAYIALFNMAFARRNGGRFILRIEDTDRTRSTRESEEAIYRSLRWVGIHWDEGPDVGGTFGPYRQSERTAHYREHTETLVARGHAYRCFCTADRLERVRMEQRVAKQTPRYDGYCRSLDVDDSRRRAEGGESFVVRLRFPTEGESVVPDALRGEVRFDNRQIDDQVLLKSDGFPTYHMANVVDDHLMGITHVIRAEEWINSTPKHIALYEAFGWEPPVFVHMPLLRNTDHTKISKRKNPTSLEYYERSGILPEAMLNFLGLMGYSLGGDREKFTLEEFVADFDIARVSLGGPVFDLAKLDWLNGLYLRGLAARELASRALKHVCAEDRHEAAAALIQERLTDMAGFFRMADIFFSDEVELGLHAATLIVGSKARKATARKLTRNESVAYFADVLERLEGVVSWRKDAIEAALRLACEKAGVAVGDGFMAVRVAVTGRPNTPPLFETLEVIGRAMTLIRLRRAHAALSRPDFMKGELAALRAEIDAVEKALAIAEAPAEPRT